MWWCSYCNNLQYCFFVASLFSSCLWRRPAKGIVCVLSEELQVLVLVPEPIVLYSTIYWKDTLVRCIEDRITLQYNTYCTHYIERKWPFLGSPPNQTRCGFYGEERWAGTAVGSSGSANVTHEILDDFAFFSRTISVRCVCYVNHGIRRIISWNSSVPMRYPRFFWSQKAATLWIVSCLLTVVRIKAINTALKTTTNPNSS